MGKLGFDSRAFEIRALCWLGLWVGERVMVTWNKHLCFNPLGSVPWKPACWCPYGGVMVTNRCTYHRSISFPQVPVAALAAEKWVVPVHYRLTLLLPKSTEGPPQVEHRDSADGFFFGHPKLACFDALACTMGLQSMSHESSHRQANRTSRRLQEQPPEADEARVNVNRLCVELCLSENKV